MKKKQVVIIGGGFGGLNAAKALKNADVELVLLDRMNHHLFQPLLYQVATAALSPGTIANPIREILRRQNNALVLMKDVVAIDKDNCKVITTDGSTFFYDALIVAAGAHQSYFGHNEWAAFAPGLKTISDALNLRNKILLAFEKAECCQNPEQEVAHMRFVIIGGGPTGVELAGAIAEIAKDSLYENFRRINPAKAEILLIEGMDHLLPSFPKTLSTAAELSLKQIGIQVMTNTRVTNITAEGIYIGTQFIPASTVIWAAGNQAAPVLKTLGVPLDREGRVIVGSDLAIADYPDLFVIGDAAHVEDENGQILPGIAPVALQQGKYVANIIARGILPTKRKPFKYKDKGMMATIGSAKAVAVIGRLKISGFVAWLMWGLIHIFYLISFQNRIFVMLYWFFLYLFGKRNVRLITTNPDEMRQESQRTQKGQL